MKPAKGETLKRLISALEDCPNGKTVYDLADELGTAVSTVRFYVGQHTEIFVSLPQKPFTHRKERTFNNSGTGTRRYALARNASYYERAGKG